MKVKVQFTVYVDPRVIGPYIEHLGTGESIQEFVRSFLMAGTYQLDETVQSATGLRHYTDIVNDNLHK